MTGKKCEHPERLNGKKPGECSPKQIKECHGDKKGHSCAGDNQDFTRGFKYPWNYSLKMVKECFFKMNNFQEIKAAIEVKNLSKRHEEVQAS